MGLLPLIFFAGFFLKQIRSSLELVSKDHLENLAKSKGLEVERFIETEYKNIQSLSENPILKSDNNGKLEKLEELNKIKNIYTYYDDISLINLDGNVVTSTNYQYWGEWKSKEWFLEAKEGQIAISDVHTILYPLRTVVIFTAPIYNIEGDINSVLAIQISMKEIWSILENVKIGKTGYAVLLDGNDKIISHPKKERLFEYLPSNISEKAQNMEGFLEYSEDEKTFLSGYYVLTNQLNYKTKGWKLFIIQQKEEPLAVYYQLRLQIILIDLITVIVLILLLFLSIKYIISPIYTLRKAVREIAEGNLNYKIKIKSNDEISDLAQDLGSMAISLKKSRKQLEESAGVLEEKVKERTKELEKTHAELEARFEELKKFEKLTVGREIMMIELKKDLQQAQEKIRSLKKQLISK